MPTNEPGGSEQGREGSSLEDALHDCVVCGVILVDARNRIGLFTAEAAQMLGMSPDPKLNSSLDTLPAPLQTMVQEARASGRPVDERPIEVGGGQTASLRAGAVPAGDGKKGVVLVLKGLSLAGQSAESLRQLNRLAGLGTLSASMAHEIRNALVACKTFTDLLLEKHQDAELAGVVRRELGRIDAIVSRVLKFAGPNRAPFGAVHLHQTLEHSLRLVRPQMESKAIELEQSFQAAHDTVHGDDYELEQAFVNLMLNALDAMGPNGKLTVATEAVSAGAGSSGPRNSPAAPQQLRVTIRDTGVGIPAEKMDRLFEPFYTTKAGGTGLGLAITRQILRKHGGDIAARSDAGQGTTFTVVLPASPAPKGPCLALTGSAF
jgi:two-component system sensor histidine kinase HydH